jgi:hypothetical protein
VGLTRRTCVLSSIHTDALEATTQLYRTLYPTLFRLATDLHPVTRLLFSELVPQLTRWFTRARRWVTWAVGVWNWNGKGVMINVPNNQSTHPPVHSYAQPTVPHTLLTHTHTSHTHTPTTPPYIHTQHLSTHPETEALLDALTDGLGKAESGPVRALCAHGLAEFLEYAIRQTTRTRMERSPVMAEALLTRLERLARHPNRYRRLGGAMALLKSLRFLRDEVKEGKGKATAGS